MFDQFASVGESLRLRRDFLGRFDSITMVIFVFDGVIGALTDAIDGLKGGRMIVHLLVFRGHR